jgi:hypothetical protein
MPIESAAEARVRIAAVAYDHGVVRASRNIATRSRHRSWRFGPVAAAGFVVVWLVLPKKLRKPLVSAALPLFAASLRGLFK